LVLKFGGHALANAARIRLAAGRIAAWRRREFGVIAVVSAKAGETDRLFRWAGACTGGRQYADRELDRLLCTGEDRSAALLALALNHRGLISRSLRGGEAGIIADGPHGNAAVVEVRTGELSALLARQVVPVVSGFQGLRPDGEAVTLGRGASDLSAVAIAAALNAWECHLIKDVDAVHEADPRGGSGARPLASLSHADLETLVARGAKVVNSAAAALARQRCIPVRVYGYRAPLAGAGTRIGEAA
jgi:aspartate kinase